MLRKAQSMAQLSHPNVVGIYNAETTERGVSRPRGGTDPPRLQARQRLHGQ